MVRASLDRSPRIAIALAIGHITGAVAVVPLEVAAALKAALVLAIVASLVHSICRHALLFTKNAVLTVEVRDQETAALQARDGKWRDARILATSYVTAALTVLNLRVAGERLPRHVLLVRDNVDEQEFRRVRVLLRWPRPVPPETSDRKGAAE
jgi:hypothetical protein